MNTSMITSSVSMGQLQKKLDTISNNIANVNTNGFKRREATFSDLLFQQVNNQSNPSKEIGRLTPDGLLVGSGARIAQTQLILTQGPLQSTERELDFALTEKDQFFRIQTMENGEAVERLTRDGAFYVTESLQNDGSLVLVTGNGEPVLNSNGGTIHIPENFQSITVSENGNLTVTTRDGATQNVAELGIARVLKPQLLEAVGGNQYALPDVEDLGLNLNDIIELLPMNEVAMIQGSLEGSNVDLSSEMTELITMQRQYQFNSRSLSMADEMNGLINGIRR